MIADTHDPYCNDPSRYVKISVMDTGIGMDQKTQERIFEPFFTTKEIGRGTGLGLSSVYGIIKNHRGHIDVESKRGLGTTLSIFLPAFEEEVRRQVEAKTRKIASPETILIVDDEKIILSIGRQLLEKLGYRVLTAASGEAGIDMFRQKRDAIDLVVLDMIIPDMDGREVYRKIKRINPRVKVLISSGFNIDRFASQFLLDSRDGFIQKPFGLQNLSETLDRLLGHDPAASQSDR